MNYGLVEAEGEGSIGGGIGAVQEGAAGHVTFYVEVDDLQSYLNKAKSLGGEIIVPPTEIPNFVTFALFSDPEGNIIGMIKA